MTAPSREVGVRGPRFAAWVTGVVLAVVGWLLAAVPALVAALLDAAPGFCRGCEMCLLVRRAATLRAAA